MSYTSGEAELTCPICFDGESSSNAMLKLKCSHVVHASCFDKMLETTVNSDEFIDTNIKCCVCRTELLPSYNECSKDPLNVHRLATVALDASQPNVESSALMFYALCNHRKLSFKRIDTSIDTAATRLRTLRSFKSVSSRIKQIKRLNEARFRLLRRVYGSTYRMTFIQ